MSLETDRLQIRPWRPEEAPQVLAIHRLEEVRRWLDDGPVKLMADLAEAEAWIEDSNAIEPPFVLWAIVPKETGVPVGSAMLVPIPNSDGLVQMGYHLHPDAWGRGYATEAAAAVLAHGLTVFPVVRGLVIPGNDASLAVLRKVGMRYVGVTDDWYDSPSEVFIAP